MKELVQLLLGQTPKYVGNFLSVFGSPITFIRTRDMSSDKSMPEALTFLGLSFLFAVVLNTPLIPEQSKLWNFLGIQGVANLIWVLLAAAALRAGWWCVGGRAPFTNFLITYCYFFGVMLVLIKFFHLVAQGILKVFEPSVYQSLLDLSRDGFTQAVKFFFTIAVVASRVGHRRLRLRPTRTGFIQVGLNISWAGPVASLTGSR